MPPPATNATAVKSTNINAESAAAPVELKRPQAGSAADISDIFGGYTLEELVTPPPASPSNNPEEGLLILELRLGRHMISDALVGYYEHDKLLLPVGQLSEALQFPIQIDLDTKRAEGWFSEEDKTFLLDAANQRATISGRTESIQSNQMSVRDDDIFVDSKLLEKWFSIVFDISYAEQVVSVSGTNNTLLPAERFAERETAREALKLKKPENIASYPIVREPYSFATAPFADVYLSANYDDRARPNTRSDASILMNGDLLYMQQSSFLSYDHTTGLREARLTLSRKDPEGQLFAPEEAIAGSWLGETANDWKLTDITLGDLVNQQLPLTMLNQNGRGIMVTNQPLDRSSRYDRTTIRGDVQPNWDVELYRNDELLAFQRSNANGRYEFDDVPLLSGLNIIRLVFYGPFGQTREEIQRILVNPHITQQGTSYARFTAMQQSKNLLGNITSSDAFASNFTIGLNTVPITSVEGESRLAFEYEYGVRDNLALYAQATHTPLAGNIATDALTLGLGGVWQDIYGRLDVAKSDDGEAFQFTTQTNVMGLNLSL